MNRLMMTRNFLLPSLRGLIEYCQVLRTSSETYYPLMA